MAPFSESPRSPWLSEEVEREHLEYVTFWQELWQRHPQLAEELSRQLKQPEPADTDWRGKRCPCCFDPNRPVGVWLSEDGRIVPATPRPRQPVK